MLYDNKVDWKSLIKTYNNFPKDGVVFRDINPLFRNSVAIQAISKEFINQEELAKIDLIAGIESRGFTVASLLAKNFNKGIISVRKVGGVLIVKLGRFNTCDQFISDDGRGILGLNALWPDSSRVRLRMTTCCAKVERVAFVN